MAQDRKSQQNVLLLFCLVHTTSPNYNQVTRMLKHTLGGNFKLFCEVNQKLKRFLLFFSIDHSHYCIDQAGLGAFTAKSGRKHYNPPPLTVM